MKFAVENFKIFKERTEFDIRPITILVGPNGSGKSSVIRAMELISGIGTKRKSNSFLLNEEADTFHANFWHSLQNLRYKNGEKADIKKLRNRNNESEEIKFFITDFLKFRDIKWPITIGLNCSENFIKFSIRDDRDGEMLYFGGKVNIPAFLKIYESADFESFKTEMEAFGGLVQTKFNRTERFIQLDGNKLALDTDKLESEILQNKEIYYQQYKTEEILGTSLAKKHKLGYSGIRFLKTINGQAANDFFTNFVFRNIDSMVRRALKSYSPLNFLGTKRHYLKRALIINSVETELEKLFTAYLEQPENLPYTQWNETDVNDINSLLRYYLSKQCMNFSDDFRIDINEDGNSGAVYLIKGDVTSNLIDHGYGVINSFSVLLSLSLAHSKVHRGLDKIYVSSSSTLGENLPEYPENVKFDDDGHFESFYKTILAIEEPEMNLHPNAQSKLADVFVHSVKNHNTTLVLETHSEYLIRRLQYLVAKGELSKDMVQIYYFNDPDALEEGDERVYPININDDGSLTMPFGKGFFDEADNIALELFLTNQSQKN